jgi:hypothetical protein
MLSAALERHPAAPCAALRGVTVSIGVTAKSVQAVYVFNGDITRGRIPPPRPPRAADRLWQHTCCELFIARAGGPGYREFNFSPSGEWAAYAFDRYREGMKPLDIAPHIGLRKDAQRMELTASIPLQGGKLRIGVCAVVEDRSGSLSYWALRHAAGKPDFHHPDAFALELDEVRY